MNGFDAMLSGDGKSASSIAQTLLEQTADALMNKEFDTFAHFVSIPHVIETPDHKTILKTRAALLEVFNHVVQDHADRNVTQLVRTCEIAEFQGAFKIEAVHITHMMSANWRVIEPYPTLMLLELIEGRWQATKSQYAVDNKTTVGRALETTLRRSRLHPPTLVADTAEKRKN